MARVNYFQALAIVGKVYGEVQQVQALHDKPRFDALQADLVDLLNTAKTLFGPKDKIASALTSAAIAAVSAQKYEDVVNPPKPGPDPTPQPWGPDTPLKNA